MIMRNFNDDELVDFVELTRDKPLDVRFIEYMPFSGNEWNTKKMVSFSEMKEIIRRKYPELERLPADSPNDTSKVYHDLQSYDCHHFAIHCSPGCFDCA